MRTGAGRVDGDGATRGGIGFAVGSDQLTVNISTTGTAAGDGDVAGSGLKNLVGFNIHAPVVATGAGAVEGDVAHGQIGATATKI